MKTTKIFSIALLAALTLLATPALNAKTYYVKADATKKEKGTYKSPFSTINKAVEVAMAGDTIMVLEGVYRERVIPIRSGQDGAPIVFMGEPGKQVTIKGSDIWTPEWKSYQEGIYFAAPDPSLFNDVKEDYPDNHNPFEVLLASTPYERQGLQEKLRDYGGNPDIVYTCGQVFVNGDQFKEVAALKELSEENTWYYNPKDSSIYVNFSDQKPTEQEVEISTRRRIFAPSQRGLGYIVVQGFVMEHCGNQYPTNFWVEPKWAQRGALGIEAGHNWIIRRNVIRYAKAFAIDCGNIDSKTPREIIIKNNIIEENYIVDNGSGGIQSNQSLDMIIRNNVVMRNNTMFFTGNKRWEHGAIKCHNARNGYIHDNYVADNYITEGIWMDNNFPNARISRNVLVNNGTYGLFLEMSDYDYDQILIDNNIIIGNRRNPIYCHDASGATFIHNLIANSPTQKTWGQGLIIHQVSARTKSYHHTAYNNIFAGSLPIMEVCYPSHRGGPQRFDYNLYNTTEEDTDFYISAACEKPNPWSKEEFYEMMKSEVEAAGELKAFREENRVMLTFDQWKHFWQGHDCDNDQNSIINNETSVVYHPSSQEVVIRLGIKPDLFKSKNHDRMESDFFGNPIPQDGTAIYGPIQNLKFGFNLFDVWDGLEILGKDQLPDFERFNR